MSRASRGPYKFRFDKSQKYFSASSQAGLRIVSGGRVTVRVWFLRALRPSRARGALMTTGALGRRGRLQQPIDILVQLRQLIPALADLVAELVGAALGSEWVAYGRYK
jgi:hypothetical protein